MATFSKAADRASRKNRALAVNSSHSCMELYRANNRKDTCKKAGNCMDKASHYNNRACHNNNNSRAVNNIVTTTGEGNNSEQVVLVFACIWLVNKYQFLLSSIFLRGEYRYFCFLFKG